MTQKPEPCCVNCGNLIKEVETWGVNYSCHEVTKAVLSGNDPIDHPYEIVDLTFYCKYWRKKNGKL